MANKKANEVTKKATANAKEATTMKKETTKKVETKKAVKTEEKKVETKKVEAKKENKAKINITMTEFEELLNAAHIGFKPNNCEYRILKSNTAIHILKSKIYINCTTEDFKTISEKVKTEDMKLQPQGNKIDDKRPDRVEFTSVETLKAVIKAIAANNAVVVAA
jgi:hypothetical protein